MSSEVTNDLNSANLKNLSSVNYNFSDDSMEEIYSEEDNTIERTANLVQNSISNAGNSSIPNAHVDSNLSGRIAPMGPQESPLLAVIAQVAKPLLTEYIPQALLIGAGVFICASVPATLGLGALGFAPLCFFGAMWLYTSPNADEIKGLEQQTEILNQRIGKLTELNKFYKEIEKLQEEQNETGGSEEFTAQIEAKKMELENAWETLKNFDMQYGIDSSAGESVENLEGSEETDESSGIEYLNSGIVNHEILEDEEDETDEGRLAQISNLRDQVAELSEEVNLVRGSKITVQDFENLKSSLSNHKLLLADLLMEEILAIEEKADLLVNQEDEATRLYESIKSMETEYDNLVQNLVDDDQDSDIDFDFGNDFKELAAQRVKIKQQQSDDDEDYEIFSDTD